MIKTCLIGVSGFGDVHYRDVLRRCAAGKMQILGVCVINQDEEQEKCAALKKLGATIHSDYQDMLDTYAGQIQLCMIPTGIPLHKPMTIAALQAGANVFVEKPAAGIIDDVDAMMAAEAAHPGFVAVGYQSMYNSGVHKAKQLLLDGIIGQIHEVRCMCLGPRMDSYYARNNWAGTLQVGDTWVLDSPFSNAFSHFINLSLFFAGTSFSASCTPRTMHAELYRGHDIPSCDTASWLIETEEDIAVRFLTSHCSAKGEAQTFKIIGDKGHMQWSYNYDESQIIFYDQAGEILDQAAYTFSRDRDDIHDALAARIADPSAFVCTLDIARVPVLVSNAAFMAAPIHTIDAEYVERVKTLNGDVQTIVPGMHGCMWQAFELGLQVHEIAPAWSQPEAVLAFQDVEAFGGCR